MRQLPRVAVIQSATGGEATRDAELIARARLNDRDAFALLIESRAPRLLRTARVILGNETDAYECAQEALIAAWMHLPGLRDSTRFDAWLNRTLVNKCRDALRRRGRVREIDIAAAPLAVEDSADDHATQVSILAAFDRLTLDHRQILALHYVDELPLAELAEQLGIPVGTAKSRLWSARRALERALEAER